MDGKCPVCKGQIEIKTLVKTGYGPGAECQLVSGSSYLSIESIFCDACGILFDKRVLGDFILSDKKPFWRPLTNEKCGAKCRSFTEHKCHHPYTYGFTYKDKKACLFFKGD